MGRTRKILENNKKHLTKAEQKERQAFETGYRVGRDELLPSDMLTERGQAEFERLKRQATWLDNIDRNDLTVYCYYWERTASIDGVLSLEGAKRSGSTRLARIHLRDARHFFETRLDFRRPPSHCRTR